MHAQDSAPSGYGHDEHCDVARRKRREWLRQEDMRESRERSERETGGHANVRL